MSVVRTLKEGPKLNDRRIIDVNTGALPTADPSSPTEGFKVRHSEGATFLHLYAEFSVPITVTVTVWYFSSIANQWFEGDQVAFGATSKLALVQTEGEEKYFFVVDSATGSTGQFQLWAGYSWGMIQHQ